MTTEPVVENNDPKKDIIQWGVEYLASNGYTLKSNLPENVQDTPWSYVVRFSTSDGYIYLKRTPKLIALEATIIQILHDQFKISVPEVISHNVELNCFLMKDAGRPLREILKKKFSVALVCKAIDQFTLMQLAVTDHINIFFEVGVPDWRLDKLSNLFKQLLLQKEILVADGLSQIEISELESLLPTISNLCKKLSAYSIKETIVQPDFNDNNTLINDASQNMTIIDLGEIVISHPFFSLLNFLQQMKKHHALNDEDSNYLMIQNACLKNFLVFESKENLLDALKTTRILWLVYGVLAYHRLMVACDETRLISFQGHGKLSSQLKALMKACLQLTENRRC